MPFNCYSTVLFLGVWNADVLMSEEEAVEFSGAD